MQTATDPQGAASGSGSQSLNEFSERLHFENLLTNIAARFANLPLERIDAAITDSQRMLCDFLRVDRSILWQFPGGESASGTMSHVHDTFL